MQFPKEKESAAEFDANQKNEVNFTRKLFSEY